MDINQAFGLTVKELRSEKGYSQKELASRANLDDRYIGSIERAVKNPTLKAMSAIATGLDMQLWIILKFAQEKIVA